MRRAAREEQASPSETVTAEPKLAAAADVAEDVGDPADVGAWESAKTEFPIVADPRGHAADRQGDVLLVPDLSEPAQQRRGLPVGSGPPRGAAGHQEPARQGQHLVRRPDLHGRRRAGRVRRQPDYESAVADLEGPRPGVHVQPVDRDLARAARDGPRPLVPDRRADAERPDPDRERAGRVGHPAPALEHEPGHRAVHAAHRPRRARDDQEGRLDRHRRRGGAGQEADRPALPADGRDGVRSHGPRRARQGDELVHRPGRPVHVGRHPEPEPRPHLGHHRAPPLRSGRADAAARHGRHPVQRRAVDDDDRAVRRGTAAAAGSSRPARTTSTAAGTPTPSCCPTARWSRSAAGAAASTGSSRPCTTRSRRSATSSSGIRRPASGGSARSRPRRGPTTRPPCCSRTGA